jgi:hypothetical protein
MASCSCLCAVSNSLGEKNPNTTKSNLFTFFIIDNLFLGDETISPTDLVEYLQPFALDSDKT